MPERKHSLVRRMSDVEQKVIKSPGEQESKPRPKAPVRRAFDLQPLPDKFNFVDKIKAPYEVGAAKGQQEDKPVSEVKQEAAHAEVKASAKVIEASDNN